MLAAAEPVASEPGIEDEADQSDEVDPVLCGKDRQVRMRGVEAGERICLEEMRLALRIGVEIDTRCVTALKRPVSRKRPQACTLRFRVGSRRVDHKLLAQLLVAERVD